MTTPIIKALDLKKSYNGKPVINGLSLSVNEGEFISIIGESGAGKSTLLYILAGIERPDSGKVFLANNDIFSLDDKKLSELRQSLFGFVFQFDNLLPNLTVAENLSLPLSIAKRLTKEKLDEIDRLLSQFKISDIKDKLPAQISGGEQQRASIVRALIINPKILFLDEPTGSLDSSSAEQVMQMLKDINENRSVTVVQVTHSAKYAAVANKIFEVKDGTLL